MSEQHSPFFPGSTDESAPCPPPEWWQDLSRIHEEVGEQGLEALQTLVTDVCALYRGEWPGYEACQVRYHSLGHALDVALAAARMMAGWNRRHPRGPRLGQEEFLLGITAALLHDAGYLKDRGDGEGAGGKFTFVHVERSRRLAREYLALRGWSGEQGELVADIIDQTEFSRPPRFEHRLREFPGRALAGIVGSADLLAQMADPHYMERLADLFSEFQEAYDFEGREALRARGLHVFASVEEMERGTLFFFEKLVVPRFQQLEGMVDYLEHFFGSERNPYMESIVANLYRSPLLELAPRQRIGELLVERGAITPEVLVQALHEQGAHPGAGETRGKAISLGNLVRWINRHSGHRYLGDVLVRMGRITAPELRRIVEEQLLPPNVLEVLSPADLAALLRLGFIVGNVRQVPHVFRQVLEMVCELLHGEAGSLLLVDEERHGLVIIQAVGPHSEGLEGLIIPWDKGVAGWVFSNRKAAAVNNTNQDQRFYQGVDSKTGFSTRSLLAVPLFIQDRVMGVLEVLNKRGEVGVFDERDLFVLSLVAQQMGGALDVFLWMMEKGNFPSLQGH